ncbi:hypothetical protein [Photobacterium leiognathi]|uniref:hypothetical protein n=1 Tax=Photobacterium leiognathi TaxID=553611 RepID=UPI0029824876|nr:hypothetical protein [Photobacterium leiognathi]
MDFKLLPLITVLSITLIGCGGGGGSDDSTPPPEPEKPLIPLEPSSNRWAKVDDKKCRDELSSQLFEGDTFLCAAATEKDAVAFKNIFISHILTSDETCEDVIKKHHKNNLYTSSKCFEGTKPLPVFEEQAIIDNSRCEATYASTMQKGNKFYCTAETKNDAESFTNIMVMSIYDGDTRNCEEVLNSQHISNPSYTTSQCFDGEFVQPQWSIDSTKCQESKGDSVPDDQYFFCAVNDEKDITNSDAFQVLTYSDMDECSNNQYQSGYGYISSCVAGTMPPSVNFSFGQTQVKLGREGLTSAPESCVQFGEDQYANADVINGLVDNCAVISDNTKYSVHHLSKVGNNTYAVITSRPNNNYYQDNLIEYFLVSIDGTKKLKLSETSGIYNDSYKNSLLDNIEPANTGRNQSDNIYFLSDSKLYKIKPDFTIKTIQLGALHPDDLFTISLGQSVITNDLLIANGSFSHSTLQVRGWDLRTGSPVSLNYGDDSIVIGHDKVDDKIYSLRTVKDGYNTSINLVKSDLNGLNPVVLETRNSSIYNNRSKILTSNGVDYKVGVDYAFDGKSGLLSKNSVCSASDMSLNVNETIATKDAFICVPYSNDKRFVRFDTTGDWVNTPPYIVDVEHDTTFAITGSAGNLLKAIDSSGASLRINPTTGKVLLNASYEDFVE